MGTCQKLRGSVSPELVTTAELRFRVPTAEDADAIGGWLAGPNASARVLDRENSFYSVLDGQARLVGYCCFGQAARVAGGDYPVHAIDMAAGWPEDAGADMWEIVLAVALFARALFNVAPLRTTVPVNQRVIRAWEAAGFWPMQRFNAVDGGEYLQLGLPP